jgi:hypothetical protein
MVKMRLKIKIFCFKLFKKFNLIEIKIPKILNSDAPLIGVHPQGPAGEW